MTVRVVLQAVDSASVLVGENVFVRIGRGVLIYVSFINNTTEADVAAAVETLIHAKIFTHLAPEKLTMRPLSLLECPDADIMIVPQASLGGKLKGNAVQFHSLVEKSACQLLFTQLCTLFRKWRGIDASGVTANGGPLDPTPAERGEGWLRPAGRVVNGTFGNRQEITMSSEGPFSHFFDLKHALS